MFVSAPRPIASLALLPSAPIDGGGDPKFTISFSYGEDPFLPWLRKALDDLQQDLGTATDQFRSLLEECIRTFADEEMYCSDVWLVKVWILYEMRFKISRGFTR